MAHFTYLGGLPAGQDGDRVAVDIAGDELHITHRPGLRGALRHRSSAWARVVPLATITDLTLDSGANLAARQSLLWGFGGLAGPWQPDTHYLIVTILIDEQAARVILTAPEPDLRALRDRLQAALPAGE